MLRSRILCYPVPAAPLTSVIHDGNMGGMILQATNTFRSNLRAAMLAQGVSQRDLAHRAGTGYPNLNRVLNGRQNITLELADRLADALALPLPALLEKKSRRQAS